MNQIINLFNFFHIVNIYYCQVASPPLSKGGLGGIVYIGFDSLAPPHEKGAPNVMSSKSKPSFSTAATAECRGRLRTYAEARKQSRRFIAVKGGLEGL